MRKNRNKRMGNKKGSVSVFLASILITMIMAGMVFAHAAKQIAKTGENDAVLNLAGRSVLAEFDRRLESEYGLFAFYGQEDRVATDLRYYSQSVPAEQIRVNLAEHAMIDVNVFEAEVLDYMNDMIAEKGISYLVDRWKKTRTDNTGGEEGRVERILRNGAEIASLPSNGVKTGGRDLTELVSKGLPSFAEILNEGSSLFRVNEYILRHFKYRIGGEKRKETFFENEVEYILHGKLSDAENRRAFRLDFLILRSTLNALHIYGNSQKRGAALALAEVLTPGPCAVITQGLLIAAWGAAEGENDARLLEAGAKVDFFKSEDTWALDLKSAIKAKVKKGDGEGADDEVEIKNVMREGYIAPLSDKGMAYEEYLRLFLYLEKRETKLLRAMDLIQLNLRGAYCKDFLMKDHFAGFHMEVLAEGKTYAYEQNY